MSSVVVLLLGLGVCAALTYHSLSGASWSLALLILSIISYSVSASFVVSGLFTVLFALSLMLNVTALRRRYISDYALQKFKQALPHISQTEQEALDAGTVWWDGDLFEGNPDWRKLLAFPQPALNAEERAFLDGPVEALCGMLDDWKISYELNDLPREVWQFIKDQGFLGMIIPKQYGGLGFSALAHSEVVMKLSSRNSVGAVSVMVPNSLGPAELLLRYGTEEQKSHYLPRLAKGLEMPCFALTGPEAGSDAASIPDRGIVCYGEFDGKQNVLGMRLTWEKRYITLGPVATILGLAFKLYDPDHLLGDKEDLGITLALIPTQTRGVNIGRRHFPLNASFQNGPNSGKDVFIPLEWIIGGRARIGQGWRMLMECLAAGRSISLPASSTGASKLAAQVTGAYSRIRTQFKTPIGRFEGVEEALARIGGAVYMMDAARIMTAGAVDAGEKPAVVSAIAKYHLTEKGRQVINDAMDVHGGKGICLGPNNYLGRLYQQIPISITVEGANILTRSLIIFGQGAIRCHPYVLQEIEACRESDPEQQSSKFDSALWGHLAFIARNTVRTLVFGLTAGLHAQPPGPYEARRYYRYLSRFCAAFALCADVSMLILGGSLKRKEKISARLGDILSHLYLCSASLKRFHDDGYQQTDLPLLEWGVQDSLYTIQQAFDELFQNFPNRILGLILRGLVFPLGQRFSPPSDALGHQVAKLLLEPSATRERLCRGIFISSDEDDAVGRLEIALKAVIAAETVEAKVRAAVKAKSIEDGPLEVLLAQASMRGIVSADESALLEKARILRRASIMVDDFPADVGQVAGVSASVHATTERKLA